MDRSPEPGLLRVFRHFTGIAMVYFALVLAFTFLETRQAISLQAQTSLNFLTSLGLFGYLSQPWLARRLKQLYLPIGLIAATVIPVFSNLLYLADPPELDMYVVIARSWVLLPILVVPLVLIAWQYRFRWVVAFIVFTAGVELLVLLPVIGKIDVRTFPVLGVPLIRAFAFGTVGHIVTRLIDTQRAQRQELVRANVRLAQHAQTLEQLTLSRERNRLARELHDTLAHTLSGLAVNLEAMKTVAPAENTELQQMLDHALRATRTGLDETRRTLKDLRARPLEDLGLSLALRTQANSIAARADLALAIELTGDVDGLQPRVQQALYRIAQEGLENVTRHARAHRARLSLARTADETVLAIEDDGTGVRLSDAAVSGSYGLQGMRERAEEIGATFTFDSRPGAGTIVRVVLKETRA
ncbi:MAG: sensor histidine kinase [Anaerolineae bacterium]|nr:sensor histidine kinase [Anaerolineae bacterium]